MSSVPDLTIDANCVVHFHYTLQDASGNVLESSRQQDPMGYLHGHKNIIPGLETELSGKRAGDSMTVNVVAAQGYGERDDALISEVPRHAFPDDPVPAPGMQFQAEGPDGVRVVTVTAVSDETVTVDGNHALAGQDLVFDVEIVSVRAATDEEISHGHVHGPGGHHH